MMTCTRRNENPLTVFEDVFGSLFNDSLGTLTKATQANAWSPAVDIVESPSAYTLTADLPGTKKPESHILVFFILLQCILQCSYFRHHKQLLF